MMLSTMNNCNARQIDFVLAYPQADAECDLCMKLSRVFETSTGDRNTYVILLKRNSHDQR